MPLLVSIPKLEKLQIVTSPPRTRRKKSSKNEVAFLKFEERGKVHVWMKFASMRNVHKMQRILELTRGTMTVPSKAIKVLMKKNQVLARMILQLHFDAFIPEWSSEFLSVNLFFLKQVMHGVIMSMIIVSIK
jgi:hypothetical protein